MAKKQSKTPVWLKCLLALTGGIPLAAMLLPITGWPHKRAGKLKARNSLSSLVTAIDGYYTDYDRLPSNSPEPPKVDSLVRTDEIIMSVLAGINVEGMNQKQNVYYNGPAAKGSDLQGAYNGLYENATLAQLFDPWQKRRGGERAYILLLDYDGDGILEDPFRPGRMLGQRVVGWSAGKDGKWEPGNPKKGVNKDNVYSWFD